MGCVCTQNINDKYSIENILGSEYDKNTITSKQKLTDYVKKVFYLINKIRTDPPKFADVVISYEKYIKEENDKKIFDHKLKVALNEGKKMFEDSAEYLRKLSPMPELTFNDDIVLECPEEANNIKDINYFKQKVTEKMKEQKIQAYFKDSIKEPEISVLLMIVDDAIKNPKKKRETVLNPNFKFVGISSTSNENEVPSSNAEGTNNNGNTNNTNGNTNSKNENGLIKKPFCAYFAFK